MVDLVKEGPQDSVATKGTVLVVDDELMVRNCVSMIFTGLGFHVITAGDGLEALEIYRDQGDSISLVFMDITMPRMDGITATQKIRVRDDNYTCASVTTTPGRLE